MVRMGWISTKDALPIKKQIVMVTIRSFLWDHESEEERYSGEWRDTDTVSVALFDPAYKAPFEVPYLAFEDGSVEDIGGLSYGCSEERLCTGYVNNAPQYLDGPNDYVIAWAPLPERYKEEDAQNDN